MKVVNKESGRIWDKETKSYQAQYLKFGVCKLGEMVLVKMPWSEVCMSMRIADKIMAARLIPSKYWGAAAQIFDPNTGREFCCPILHGEAGFYSRENGNFIFPMYE